MAAPVRVPFNNLPTTCPKARWASVLFWLVPPAFLPAWRSVSSPRVLMAGFSHNVPVIFVFSPSPSRLMAPPSPAPSAVAVLSTPSIPQSSLHMILRFRLSLRVRVFSSPSTVVRYKTLLPHLLFFFPNFAVFFSSSCAFPPSSRQVVERPLSQKFSRLFILRSPSLFPLPVSRFICRGSLPPR